MPYAKRWEAYPRLGAEGLVLQLPPLRAELRYAAEAHLDPNVDPNTGERQWTTTSKNAVQMRNLKALTCMETQG